MQIGSIKSKDGSELFLQNVTGVSMAEVFKMNTSQFQLLDSPELQINKYH